MRKKIILNNNQLEISLNRLACQLSENHGDFKDTVLVGLQPRGKSLCNKIVEILSSNYDISGINYGFLDITFFRDDFRRNSDVLVPSETDFKLLIENKKVVFIDDVLYTGRTIRAALTAIETFGRPISIELLILVDRRYSRELPIQPDYKGVQVDVYDNQKVNVEWNNNKLGNYVYIENLINE
ncbi:MAG: bifunctional pyr operon transcriptional regulator/uracil phosphoribosyltransferase PyrR [Flavobacteriaceae bacterium]|nr:bifunctional pyr operon transcriptional regulator/uracil phosphoribosyltransferase [Flavobacteriales bacterium]MBA42252.1 bifunctional pyr operon transcriptional regulator/uracil phosphoribosyltransferase [Flavobacteriaceae bacterium]|tara:strand:- start:778 stop:1326 length:549 start_codon:yes stop_codon:yes gene_type:complete